MTIWPETGRRQSGQATVEYVLIASVLALGLLLPFGSAHKGFMGAILDAYRTYFDSFYFVLNLPFP